MSLLTIEVVEKTGFLFDLDGVIIDSEPEYSRIWRQINQEFPTGIESFENHIKGCTLEKILSEYYPDETVREAVSKRLHELEGKMHYEFIPGAKEFLIELKAKGFPMVLVTSSDLIKMRHLSEEIPDFNDLFDHIITSEDVAVSKPSPEGYLLAAERISIDPKHCIVFEDSLQGVKAGHNAGSFVVGITATLGADILKPWSDHLSSSLQDLDINSLLQSISKK